jgi:hypothetical protein
VTSDGLIIVMGDDRVDFEQNWDATMLWAQHWQPRDEGKSCSSVDV